MISLRLAEYIESEPARKKAEQEAKKAKLEALERKLGISKDSGSSEGKKRRFDDTEYLEQSQEIVDNVKNAVTAGMYLHGFPDDSKLSALQRYRKRERRPSLLLNQQRFLQTLTVFRKPRNHQFPPLLLLLLLKSVHSLLESF